MKLIEAYALQSGLKISRPLIIDEFFPLPFDKYITVHTGGGNGEFNSKLYDYWNDVMLLIKPSLEEYKFVQIGEKDDLLLNGIDGNILGKTNVKQCNYILKRSSLHIGNDSFPIHVASALDVPVVSVYGPTTIANHSPYWMNEKSILLESHRNGQKPNFSRQEAPKTINMVYPEIVANSILKILDKPLIKESTVFMGEQYARNTIEYIPDVLVHPNNLQGKFPNIRLDYFFNEEITFQTLSKVKSSVITDQKLNLDTLKQLKPNIIIFAFEIKEDTSYEYLMQLKQASLPLRFFSKETDPKQLSKLRAKFFEIGTIEFLDENPKPIKDFNNENLYFKSSKIIVGGGKIYNSFAHYKAKNETNQIIDSKDFWKDKNFFWIYKK